MQREAAVLTRSCENFSEYITGLRIFIETDHKPLVQILQAKPIDYLTSHFAKISI